MSDLQDMSRNELIDYIQQQNEKLFDAASLISETRKERDQLAAEKEAAEHDCEKWERDCHEWHERSEWYRKEYEKLAAELTAARSGMHEIVALAFEYVKAAGKVNGSDYTGQLTADLNKKVALRFNSIARKYLAPDTATNEQTSVSSATESGEVPLD